ncbi:MAG: hypothetical protein OWR62_10515 [Sulfobacillus thermotolerans]|nr:hypothetical protein [Sulfobacillus thermotolerans]
MGRRRDARLQIVGIVAQNPAQWKRDISCPVRWKELVSVNQIFDALRDGVVDALALELKWFDDVAWLSAILAHSWTTSINLFLLVEYEQRRWVPLGNPSSSSLFCTPESVGCIVLDAKRRKVWHHGMELALPWRAAELLALLGQRPGIPATLDNINQMSLEIGWPLWTEATTKAAVYQIRRALGEEHVETIRRHGYLFVPCEMHEASSFNAIITRD